MRQSQAIRHHSEIAAYLDKLDLPHHKGLKYRTVAIERDKLHPELREAFEEIQQHAALSRSGMRNIAAIATGMLSSSGLLGEHAVISPVVLESLAMLRFLGSSLKHGVGIVGYGAVLAVPLSGFGYAYGLSKNPIPFLTPTVLTKRFTDALGGVLLKGESPVVGMNPREARELFSKFQRGFFDGNSLYLAVNPSAVDSGLTEENARLYGKEAITQWNNAFRRATFDVTCPASPTEPSQL